MTQVANRMASAHCKGSDGRARPTSPRLAFLRMAASCGDQDTARCRWWHPSAGQKTCNAARWLVSAGNERIPTIARCSRSMRSSCLRSSSVGNHDRYGNEAHQKAFCPFPPTNPMDCGKASVLASCSITAGYPRPQRVKRPTQARPHGVWQKQARCGGSERAS